VVVQRVGAAWAEKTGKDKSRYCEMVSDFFYVLQVSFLYLIAPSFPVNDQMSANPVGYIGAPEDVASLVGFIASKESHFITGQAVSSGDTTNTSEIDIIRVLAQISCDGGFIFD
jgi:NAD(P)-dependent dehydrogenase (short-subunit alcohol dehydrogenase family)